MRPGMIALLLSLLLAAMATTLSAQTPPAQQVYLPVIRGASQPQPTVCPTPSATNQAAPTASPTRTPTGPAAPTASPTRTPTRPAAPTASPTRTASPTQTASPVPPPAGSLRVNAPYFAVADVDSKFSELAIFWFGQVTPGLNYTDVRIGYSNSELYLYLAVFDRLIWYDTTPQAADLANWDAITLYLDSGTQAGLSSNSYCLVSQFSREPVNGRSAYQQAYRGNGGTWTSVSLPFSTRSGWRSINEANDNLDDKGWATSYRIPFSSLGLSTRPPDGTTWRIALALHDRDDAANTPIADQVWPPGANLTTPSSWSSLVFGLPTYTPPPSSNTRDYMIRHRLNGVVVPDVAAGGGSVCGGSLDYWSAWGNYARDNVPDDQRGDFNIQNQSDIADWPCFSKYFVTFPLNSLPPGRSVISATLLLHHFGNSQPEDAQPSLIQVLTVGTDWTDRTLTWNNAPLATENVGAGWVDPLPGFAGFPGVPRTFDVSRAVAQAYAEGGPLRLALYSADNAYHSGKYFITSDTGDWNAVGRPTLLVRLSE